MNVCSVSASGTIPHYYIGFENAPNKSNKLALSTYEYKNHISLTNMSFITLFFLFLFPSILHVVVSNFWWLQFSFFKFVNGIIEIPSKVGRLTIYNHKVFTFFILKHQCCCDITSIIAIHLLSIKSPFIWENIRHFFLLVRERRASSQVKLLFLYICAF